MKIALKILLGLLVIVVLAVVFIYIKGDDYVESFAKDKIQKLSQSTYTLQTGNVDVGLFPPTVTATNISITSHDSTYIALDSATSMLLNLQADKIALSNIGLIDLIFNNTTAFELHADSLVIAMKQTSGADSAIRLEQNGNKQSTLIIKSVSIDNGFLTYHQAQQKITTGFAISGDKMNLADKPMSILNQLSVSLSNTEIINDKTLTRLHAESTSLDRARTISLQSITYQSIPDKYELGQKLGHEADWYDISIASVTAKNDRGIIANDSIHIASLAVGSMQGVIFRDKRLAFPKDIADKKLPHELISAIEMPFNVDSLSLVSSKITYQEQIKDSPQAGEVFFSDLSASGKGLSNYGDKFDLRATARLMGTGRLDVRIMIPQSTQQMPYEVYGTIYEHDITAINPMIKYVAKVKLEEGSLKKSTFQFTHNSTQSSGEIKLAYDNLNFQIINPNGSTTLGKIGKRVASFFANTLIIENDNLRSEGLDPGKISFTRDPKKSVINFWWKSLFSGIISSLELPISAKSKES